MQLTWCVHNQLLQSWRLLAAECCCAPAGVSASTELLTRDWAPWPAPSSGHQTTATSEHQPRAWRHLTLHLPFHPPAVCQPPVTAQHQATPGAQCAYSGRALDRGHHHYHRARAEEDRECGWITGNYICQNHPELSIKSWVLHYDRTSGSAASVHLN